MIIKIPFGIKNLEIGSLCITTIKIIVSDIDLINLPSEIRVRTTAKGKILLEYSSSNMMESSRVVRQLGIVLKTKAIHKVMNKYNWV